MKRRLTITQWFGVTIGVLLVVGVAGLVAGLVALARLSDARELLADRLDPAATRTLQLTAAIVDQETGVRGYALEPRAEFLQPYRNGRRAQDRLVTGLRPLLPAAAARDLDQALGDLETWRSDYAEPTIRTAAQGAPTTDAEAGKARFDMVRERLAGMQADLAAARAAARGDLTRQANTAERIFIAFGLVLLASVVATGLMLRRVVVSPLKRLATDAREVSRGEFARELEGSGAREVVELGTDVDAMRRRIVDELARLEAAQDELVRQAQELERSNAELEQFAYVASHDLQEPLRKVTSFCQMLEMRYKGQLDERADQYIEFAVDGAKRMQQLINDLLAFSRVGRLTQEFESVDTAELVARAERALGVAIEESSAEIVYDSLPTVRGEATLLGLVFQNLIGNAIKFHGDGAPRVQITAERDGDVWRFRCADNGIGIDPQYADRIFVIFQRLHARSAYDGTGIGLAMCRKIIEYHGGRIWLDESVAEGSTFLFTLPAEEAPTV